MNFSDKHERDIDDDFLKLHEKKYAKALRNLLRQFFLDYWRELPDVIVIPNEARALAYAIRPVLMDEARNRDLPVPTIRFFPTITVDENVKLVQEAEDKRRTAEHEIARLQEQGDPASLEAAQRLTEASAATELLRQHWSHDAWAMMEECRQKDGSLPYVTIFDEIADASTRELRAAFDPGRDRKAYALFSRDDPKRYARRRIRIGARYPNAGKNFSLSGHAGVGATKYEDTPGAQIALDAESSHEIKRSLREGMTAIGNRIKDVVLRDVAERMPGLYFGNDEELLFIGIKNVVTQLLEDFPDKLPDVIILPDRGGRPLAYALRPILKEIASERGCAVPTMHFFPHHHDYWVREVKYLSKRGETVEKKIAEAEHELSKVAGDHFKMAPIYSELHRLNDIKEGSDEALGPWKERARRIIEHHRSVAGSDPTVAIIDEYATNTPQTIPDIQWVFTHFFHQGKPKGYAVMGQSYPPEYKKEGIGIGIKDPGASYNEPSKGFDYRVYGHGLGVTKTYYENKEDPFDDEDDEEEDLGDGTTMYSILQRRLKEMEDAKKTEKQRQRGKENKKKHGVLVEVDPDCTLENKQALRDAMTSIGNRISGILRRKRERERSDPGNAV